MASVDVFNAVEGAQPLAEYRGIAGDVVLLTTYAVPIQSYAFRDAPLALAHGLPLPSYRDTFFTENISQFQMTPTVTLFADSNGVAHWFIPASGLSAGTALFVQTTTLT